MELRTIEDYRRALNTALDHLETVLSADSAMPSYRSSIDDASNWLDEMRPAVEVAPARSRQDHLVELRAQFAQVEVVFDNEVLGWATRYDVIFARAPRIATLMRELGFGRLDYYDPDMDYEDDVRAYVSALRDQLKPLLDRAV
jgi:hypothetical protein